MQLIVPCVMDIRSPIAGPSQGSDAIQIAPNADLESICERNHILDNVANIATGVGIYCYIDVHTHPHLRSRLNAFSVNVGSGFRSVITWITVFWPLTSFPAGPTSSAFRALHRT